MLLFRKINLFVGLSILILSGYAKTLDKASSLIATDITKDDFIQISTVRPEENEHGKIFTVNDTIYDTGEENGDPNSRCGGHIYLGSGIIRSPDYPGQYPNNLNCFWHLYASQGHAIKLKFLDLQVEYSNFTGNCQFDYLEIRDGTTPKSPVLGKFCGSTLPNNLISTGNSVTLYFHTDKTVRYRGFEIFYQASSEAEDCNCGPYSYSCVKHANGLKCNCLNGYSQKGDSCEENCDCGGNSYGCESHGFLNKCYCKNGYVQMGNTCEVECDCGAFSHGCAKYWNVVKCFCMGGYVQRGAKCEAECNCGSNSYSCKRYWNVLKCFCKSGYVQKNGICQVGNGDRLDVDHGFELENDNLSSNDTNIHETGKFLQ